MFLRRSLLLVLLGAGAALPWLARDWLAANSASASSSAPSGWRERIRDAWRGTESMEAAPDTLAVEEAVEQTEERQPYPLARQTRKMLAGFFGEKGDLPGAPPRPGPPSTPRSRAIVEEASRRLTPELAKRSLKCGDPLVLRLFKEEGELEIWMRPSSEPHYTLFKILRLSASAGRPGPKLREGDGQAPEGFYSVPASALRPGTKHHLGFDLGYPNELDRHLGRSGSEMMIHAGETAAGAFALSPTAMEEVYALADAALRAGQGAVPVHLFPFRLTDKRMDRVVGAGSRWTEEWANLKEGYDFFENVRLPPAVGAEAERYSFRIPSDGEKEI